LFVLDGLSPLLSGVFDMNEGLLAIKDKAHFMRGRELRHSQSKQIQTKQ
jgi:hypothetical protein